MAALVSSVLNVEDLALGSIVEVDQVGEPSLLGQLLAAPESDGEVDVCLVDGRTCQVPTSTIRVPSDLKQPGLGGSSSSFDVLFGPKSQEELVGEEVAAALFEKGFCVLRLCQSAEDQQKALACMEEREGLGQLSRLPEEVEEGYLGEGAKGKVTWLDPQKLDADRDQVLRRCDAFFSSLASSMQLHTSDVLGKVLSERTPALACLSLSDAEESDFPAPYADDGVLGDFLRTWRRSQIKMVQFLGPAVASVTLTAREIDESQEGGASCNELPHPQEEVQLECGPGTILVYRTGIFDYSISSESAHLTLSSNLLEHVEPLMLTDFKAEDALVLTMGASGPAGPKGPQVKVVNMATRLMACFDEAEGYRAGLMGGCDSGIEIPLMRWDINEYYNPDDATRMPGQAYIKHQSYVEGLDLFDNKYFEINANDARVMDPMQRHVLEVGAQNLHKMGITKKIANRTPHHGGVSVGLDKDDWDRSCAQLFNCEGGINVQAIISNRFSFIFNLRGPNYVADTACSASLAATHMGKFALMDRDIEKLDFHLAFGIHQCLMPWGLEGMGSKMHANRCFTFNESASGYMRGDGCSGLTLKFGGLEEYDAVWRASRVGQNGRGATLTAPNGIAQEEVIVKTLREAKIQPPESTIWNCHGTGTSLGDPIEVGGVRRVMNKTPRDTTLLLCTNKAHTGHLEGGAAMTTLIAAVFQVKLAASCAICHFRVLNPNLENSKFDAVMTNEVTTTCVGQSNVHVSSFGFGGTNGHCIMWGAGQSERLSSTEQVRKRIKKMAPPEVRVNGDDPALWEWDGPDVHVKPGDRYSITVSAADLNDSSITWTKEEEGGEPDDGEDDFYCITGPFNEWEVDRLEDGAVVGLRTIVCPLPASGLLEFRFLKNGEEDQLIYPETDRCTKKNASVLGPASEDQGREKNTWLIQGVPGSMVRINLFVCRGRKSVMWLPEGQ